MTHPPIGRLHRPARRRGIGAFLLTAGVAILPTAATAATVQPVLAAPGTLNPSSSSISSTGLVPFAATYQETVAFVPCPSGPPTTTCVQVHGLGTATHLGTSVEVDITSRIDFSTAPPCATLVNPLTTLRAANGDIVDYTASGQVCFTSVPGQAILSGTYTVTGGTGRFADASGAGTFLGVSQLGPPACFCATTTFTMRGTLSSPGSTSS